MDISIKEYKRVVVVAVEGRIDSATSGDFETTLMDLIQKGQTNVVLDLSGVNFLSSSGLRVMVTALKTLRQSGRDLVLAQPAEQAADSISIAGLNTLFKTYPDREDAIASF